MNGVSFPRLQSVRFNGYVSDVPVYTREKGIGLLLAYTGLHVRNQVARDDSPTTQEWQRAEQGLVDFAQNAPMELVAFLDGGVQAEPRPIFPKALAEAVQTRLAGHSYPEDVEAGKRAYTAAYSARRPGAYDER